MRVTFVVNTAASAVTPRARVVLQKALSADHELEVVETARRGHAARIARAAAKDGAEVVAVMAGDGTLSEAADGLAGTETALASIPGGSTNVYARAIGYRNDPIEATGQVLAALAQSSFERIGVGSVNGRRFLFHAGVGFDAAVIEQVERRAFLKRSMAIPLFVSNAFTTWLRHYDHSRPRFDIEIPAGAHGPAETIDGLSFAIVSKIDPYTYLGSHRLDVAPGAGLDRPLALTAFRTLDLRVILPAAASALGKGRFLARNPDVIQRSHLEELVVHGRGVFPHQVDGDFLGYVDELRFGYEPGSLTLVVPVS